MTNVEALTAKLAGNPVTSNAMELALLNRGITVTGITSEDTYTVANRKAVELAYADILQELISAPNVSEGGYSLSQSDKNSLRMQANAIYTKYGQTVHGGPKAKFVKRW
jgi:hypothetical protein